MEWYDGISDARAKDLEQKFVREWRTLDARMNKTERVCNARYDDALEIERQIRRRLTGYDLYLLSEMKKYWQLRTKTHVGVCKIFTERRLSDVELFKRKTLGEIPLSPYARDVLGNEAASFFDALQDEIPNRKHRLKASFFLACDKYMCSIPRRLPKPSLVDLAIGRRKLGLRPAINGIDRVESVGKLLGVPSEIRTDAKLLLEKYYMHTKHPMSSSPITTAASAIYITTKEFLGVEIPLERIATDIGVRVLTLRKYIAEISSNLRIA